MNNNISLERFALLFLPWGLSLLFESQPVVSYLIAWFGSFLIFFLSFSGWLKPLPKDLPIAEQIMRPIFLVQIIFAGYMASSSIFYFLNLFGYKGFHKSEYTFLFIDQNQIELTAICQRYYVLGHAAMVTGMLSFMNYQTKQRYYVEKEKLANLLMVTAIVALPVSVVFLKVPGLSQFYFQLSSLSFVAGTLALALAIPIKKGLNTTICTLLYFSNFYQALISGFKEPIILSVLILGIFLYPNYKKVVIVVFLPALLLLFAFLPTFNAVFRANAWGNNVDADDAYKLALDATLNSDNGQQDETTWEFAVYRLSEIDMFTEYIQSTPRYIDFYGLKLLQQSAIAIIPRIFWPSKPSTEALVMERVFDAGITGRSSSVSAKPAFIVDAYLSGGTIGVAIALFLYGAIAQIISVKAEHLFGGYVLGTALVFSGLFQIFWRGLSFEFIINTVFWSYISMLILFRILRSTRVLKEIE
jgi:hypothetical protein